MNAKPSWPRHRHGSTASSGLRNAKRHRPRQRFGAFEHLEPRIALTAGNLDPTFGNNGLAQTTFGQDANGDVGGEATVVIEQADGKLLVAGQATGNVGSDFALARFLANGDLDTSFGSNGVVRPSTLGKDGDIAGIEQLHDGTIVAVGMRAPTSSSYSIDVSFYTADGSPTREITDAVNFSAVDQLSGVAFQPDGKIIIVGGSYATSSGFLLTRLNADGSLDSSFNHGLPVDLVTPGVSSAGFSAAVQADGKIVVGGVGWSQANGFEAEIARFNADGSPDTAFGGSGTGYRIEPALDGYGQNLLLQSDGKIIMVGGNDGQPVWAVRYNSDGTPDPTFHVDSSALNLEGNRYDRSPQAVLADDGHVYVSGWFGIDRLNTDGSIDTSFGQNGVIRPATFPVDMLLDSSGRLLVVGGNFTTNPIVPAQESLVLAAYQAEGSQEIPHALTIPAASKTDRIEVTFSSPTQFTVSINGTSTAYTTGRVPEMVYQGTGGTFIVNDSFRTATATLSPGKLDYRFDGFHIAVTGASSVYVYGTSDSTAVLDDSPGADKFVGTRSYAQFSGAGFYEYVGGFDNVTANSSSRADVAHLYAGVGDMFVVNHNSASITSPGFSRSANGFADVYAHATRGNYNTGFIHSPGGGKLVATSSYMYLTSASHFYEMTGFDTSYGLAGDTKEVAWLYARGTESFVGRPFNSYLTASSSVNASNFATVRGVATTTSNRAFLYGSRGDDTFTVGPKSSTLVGGGLTLEARGFQRVSAFSSGGHDTAIFNGLSAETRFYATPDTAYEAGGGRLDQALGFGRIIANAGGINDSAFLTDSAGNDHIVLALRSLTLTTPTSTITVNGYQKVQAKHTAGDDTQQLQAIDFTYLGIGNWRTI